MFTYLVQEFSGSVCLEWHDYQKKPTDQTIEALTPMMEALLDRLPHGSGIDADWKITVEPVAYGFTKNKGGFTVVCANGYHAMDHAGGYAGWLDFTLTFRLDNELMPISELKKGYPADFDVLDFDLEYDRDIDELQKETDLEYGVSDEDEEYFGVDWQGNADYLDELLAAALQEWYVALFTLPLS